MPLNRTRKKGLKDKFYVVYVLADKTKLSLQSCVSSRRFPAADSPVTSHLPPGTTGPAAWLLPTPPATPHAQHWRASPRHRGGLGVAPRHAHIQASICNDSLAEFYFYNLYNYTLRAKPSLLSL